MSDFEQVLLRLKERLGVPSDKGVAALLGLGEKALNARKRRGVFPVDKLKALAADRPDLKIDVKYVLTGMSDAFDRRLEAITRTTKLAQHLYPEDISKGALVRDVLLGADLDSREIIDLAFERYELEQRPSAPRKKGAK